MLTRSHHVKELILSSESGGGQTICSIWSSFLFLFSKLYACICQFAPEAVFLVVIFEAFTNKGQHTNNKTLANGVACLCKFPEGTWSATHQNVGHQLVVIYLFAMFFDMVRSSIYVDTTLSILFRATERVHGMALTFDCASSVTSPVSLKKSCKDVLFEL